MDLMFILLWQSKQTIQKFIWLFTHGGSGEPITKEMFDEYNAQASDGKLHVDECYTTKD